MKLFSVNQGLSGQLGTLRTRYLNDKKPFLLGTSNLRILIGVYMSPKARYLLTRTRPVANQCHLRQHRCDGAYEKISHDSRLYRNNIIQHTATTIHIDRFSGDIGCIVAGQKGHDRGDLRGLPITA